MSAILRRLVGIVAAAHAAMVPACSGQTGDVASANEPSRTHLVATVEQQTSVGQTAPDELSVFLSVLKIPQSINSDRVLRLMSLRSDLPAVGNCEVIDLANRASPSLSRVERIEFVDIGDVTIASGKRSLRLARQAFPTVTDFISGVVYTSRDKHADLLPLDGRLTISARGASKLKPFSAEVRDVPRLERVQIDGTPLGQVVRISVDNAFELQWNKGAPGDVIWLEYAANSGRKVVSCAFDDSLGSARVPGALSTELGEARLTLHRLHRDSVSLPGFDQADIQFDTRVAQAVRLF